MDEQQPIAEEDATEFERKHPGCCPRCGWHMSSHGDTGYGPDCPWGPSPAFAAGELPSVLPPDGGS